jgi:uncharacterized lipoprotein YddW (UPF0748 family)
MTKRIIFVCILVLVPFFLIGQDEPKYELRSTWIASVANIDWPKYEHRNNAAAQKADLTSMLEEYRQTNINAVFLQVRPECDALYRSAYEPWSRYLTWAQGTDPGYDPLQFAIEEGHKRGIEVHVWLNPYRINASSNDGGSYYHEDHVYLKNPHWAIEYESGKKILNPGMPEVMSYIGKIVRDIVTNYDIDGVHFDDYFYAYEGTPASLDASTYSAYGNGMSLGDWRRDNINRMIDTVYHAIQGINPNVRFGVSPFGIYKNGVPQGIIGFDAYSTIYCDPLAWLRDATVDYLTPQLYWPTGGAQDFETLINWWADSCFHYGRHLYPGMGTYRLSVSPGLKKNIEEEPLLHESKYYFDLDPSGENSYLSSMEQSLLKGTDDPVAAWTLGQIGVQIDLIRTNNSKNALGSVFFSAKDIKRVSGLKDYLTQNKFTHPAIIPEITWKSAAAPDAPANLRTEILNNEYFLSWDFSAGNNQRFAIYATTEELSETELITIPDNLQAVTFETSLPLSELVVSKESRIVITAIHPIGKEGSPSPAFTLEESVPFVTLTAPANGSVAGMIDQLTWESDFPDPQYQLQISTNASFSTIVHTTEWNNSTAFAIGNAELAGETEHHWRIRAKNGAMGPYSGARNFKTGYPKIPVLLNPDNLQQDVSTRPTIQWNASQACETVKVQVSQQSNFNTIIAEELFDATTGSGKLTTELNKDAWYYIRISGLNSYGESRFTEFNTFKTSAGEIPEVTLLLPANLSLVASYDKLKWESSVTSGSLTFEIQVALDAEFNSVMFNYGWISEDELMIEDLQLEGRRTYYWKVRAKSQFGTGEYSQVRVFETGYPTRPQITSPGNLSEGNSAKTEIIWEADTDTDSVYTELSTDGFFSEIYHYERFSNDTGSGVISVSLRPFTWYFLRIRAENEYGSGVFSAVKYYKTDQGTNIPAIFDENTTRFRVYPTVVEKIVNIQSNNPDVFIEKIDIIDITGRIVFTSGPLMEKAVMIQTDKTIPDTGGPYFVKITSGAFVEVIRIFVADY